MNLDVVDGLDVFNQLSQWRLHMAHLALEPGTHDEVRTVAIKGTQAAVRRRYPDGSLDDDKTVLATRQALQESCAVEKPLPSIVEELAASIAGGAPFPPSTPVLEFRDLLALRTMLPWSIIDAANVQFPLMFRLGEPGETVQSRGQAVDVEGLPVIASGSVPICSPCTHQDEETLSDATTEVILICYTPMTIYREFVARKELARLVWMTWIFKFVEERAFLPQE